MEWRSQPVEILPGTPLGRPAAAGPHHPARKALFKPLRHPYRARMSRAHHDSGYRPDIDGLRAVAVGGVIVFHAFLRQHFGGFVGVDIFFVISGYLISGIILRELDAGRFSFARFYARRVRRIYPALVTMLLISLVFGWINLFDQDFHRLALHAASSAGFLINLTLYREAGYFDTASDAKPLLHLWSLGVEEQFYIVWPIVLLIAHRLGHRWRRPVVGITLGLLMLASFVHAVLLMRRDVSGAFYLPSARGWELLCGAALALVHARGVTRQPGPKTALALGLGGLAMLVGSLIVITADRPFPGWTALPPVLGAVMLVAAGPEGWVNRHVLGQGAMRWLGQISYPLYLWHWPVLAFAGIAGFDDLFSRAVCVVLAVALAEMTIRLVEQPLRFGGHSTLKLAGLLATMTGLGAFGLWAWLHPVNAYTSAQTTALARQLNWQLPVGTQAQRDACHRLLPQRADLARPAGNDFCYLLHDGRPDVAMIGDSMNLSLFPAMARVTRHNLLLASASEAAPFYDSRTTDWPDRSRLGNFRLTNQALDYAIAARSVRLVIMSYLNADRLFTPGAGHYIQDMRAVTRRGDITATPAPDGPATMEAAMRRTLNRLAAAGKKVIIVLPNARMSFRPDSCLDALRPVHAAMGNRPCAVPVDDDSARHRLAYVARVRAVARLYRNVTLFDAAAPLCDKRLCYAMRDGHMLYRDDEHLSEQGADLVAPGLEQAMDAALES